jgi:type IV pilus assembly protein PilM
MIWGKTLVKNLGPIGIDVTASAVRMVQVDRRDGRIVAMMEGTWPVSGAEAGDPEAIRRQATLLRQLWRHGGFRGRHVVTALGQGELIVQNVRLPGDVTDPDAAICTEAAGRLPFSLEEAELRYVPVGTVRQGENLRQEVILFACRREVIQSKLAVFELAGLLCGGLDVAPAALLRCYRAQLRRRSDQLESLALVSIQEKGSLLVSMHRGQPIFVKQIDIGSQHFDQAVARCLGLSLEEAAALRRHRGDRRQEGHDPEVEKALAEAVLPCIEKLAGEVIMCLRYCSVTFRGQAPREVILSGAEATAEMAQQLAERLGVRVRPGNPFLPFEGLKSEGQPGRWDIAVGLALWEVE